MKQKLTQSWKRETRSSKTQVMLKWFTAINFNFVALRTFNCAIVNNDRLEEPNHFLFQIDSKQWNAPSWCLLSSQSPTPIESAQPWINHSNSISEKKVMQKLQPIERFIMDSAQTCSPGTFGLKWNSRYAFCLEMFCFSFWSRITDVPDPTGLTNIKWSYQNTLTAATKSTFADLWVVFRLFWSFFGRIQ